MRWALLLLALAACGAESEPPPESEPVTVTEVCSVAFLPDGSIKCTCVKVVPPHP